MVQLQLFLSVALLHHAAGRAAGQLDAEAALCCCAASINVVSALQNAGTITRPGEENPQGLLSPRQLLASIKQSTQQHLARILPRLTEAERAHCQGTSSSSSASSLGRDFRRVLSTAIGWSGRLAVWLAVEFVPPGPAAGQASHQGATLSGAGELCGLLQDSLRATGNLSSQQQPSTDSDNSASMLTSQRLQDVATLCCDSS